MKPYRIPVLLVFLVCCTVGYAENPPKPTQPQGFFYFSATPTTPAIPTGVPSARTTVAPAATTSGNTFMYFGSGPSASGPATGAVPSAGRTPGAGGYYGAAMPRTSVPTGGYVGQSASTQVSPPKQERGALWPGESCTFENVTVTWEVASPDQTAEGWLGKLKFKGPKTALTDTTAPIKRVIDPKEGKSRLRTEGSVMVYLDEVFFELHGQVAGPTASLIYMARQEPSNRRFDGAPHSAHPPVSSICPISLNQWKFTLSDKPTKYPDGAEYLEITALDKETSTKVTMPAVEGAMRKFGRFDIAIRQISKPTCMALLSVDAQADLTMRGGDTYLASCENLFPGAETFAAYFDRLGKQYGFEVKWLDYPGHPEAADYLKQVRESPAEYVGSTIPRNGSGIVGDVLAENLSFRNVEVKWKDATHMEVAPDYAEMIAAKDAEARREAEKVAWEQRFRNEFQLAIRIYPLQYASAATINDLVQPMLNTYYLICDQSGRPARLSYRIETVKPDGRQGLTRVLSTTAERCIADDRSNSLLVMAIPQTLKEIEQAIQKWDVTRVVQGPSGRYRIEVVLLQGGKAGEKIETPLTGIKLSFAVSNIIQDLPVRPGMKVKLGEPIAFMDSTDQRLKVQQAETELVKAKTELDLAKEESDRIAQLFKKGTVTSSDATKAEAALRMAEARFEMCKLALEREHIQLNYYTLAAPTTGTIGTVLVNAHERIEAGQAVVTLIPDEKAAAKERQTLATFDSKLAARFAISEDDLKLFGFDGVAQLGKGLITLSAERSDTGRALVSLTDAYRCEVEFQDVRQPYVIVKGRLLGAQSDKPLMENTLFLEKDKPSVLGLTNLRQALILVLRLYDAPSGPPTGSFMYYQSSRSAPLPARTTTSPPAAAPAPGDVLSTKPPDRRAPKERTEPPSVLVVPEEHPQR